MPSGVRADQPAGWLRVAFEGTWDFVDWAVIHWFVTTPTTDPTMSELNDLVDLIGEAFGDNLIHNGAVSTLVSFTTVKAVYAIASVPEKMRTVRIADEAGAGSSDQSLGQACYLIDWDSSDGRRGGKPRSYIPGVTDEDMADGAHILDSSRLTMTNSANAYHNAVNALTSAPWSSIHFIDASFVNAKAYRLVPHGYEIFSGHCSPVTGTQRRRVGRLRPS